MKTSEILIKARKVLSDPRRWIKGELVHERDGGEACYCALGAIYAVTCGYKRAMPTWYSGENGYLTPNGEDQTKVDDFNRAADTLGTAVYRKTHNYEFDGDDEFIWAQDYVPAFNDDADTTYEDVQQAFSDAINSALEREAQEVVAA